MIENIIQDSNISSEEKEVVLYGLKHLEMFVASIVATILIGSVTGELKGVMLFLIMFIPLRIFAGGLHMQKTLDVRHRFFLTYYSCCIVD